MKKTNMAITRKILAGVLLLLAVSGIHAQVAADSTALQVKYDTIPYQGPLVTTKIQLDVRTCGDSVMLRWVPEDYASWKYLCDYGVNVLRVKHGGEFKVDTLAYALKPLSQAEFEAKYAPNDSNALVVMGLLYGEGRLQPGQTKAKPGSIEAGMEFNTEQDISFAFAMLIAEWRNDLALDMAVGFNDKTATLGGIYDYYIQPTQWENNGVLIFEPGVREKVLNLPYEPQPYEPQMTDSVSGVCRHVLGWWDKKHSSFEIERRCVMDNDNNKRDEPWLRINRKPYVSMVEQPEGVGYCVFADSVPHFGVYEYRIMGHDPFGGLTSPSPALKVNVYDNEPPQAPQLTHIQVEYPGESLTEKVEAHFFWRKDTLERDLTGYVIYYNNQGTDGEWQLLTDNMISPTDTTTVVDVSSLRTGMVRIVAVDKSGNEASSFAQLLELKDFNPPAAPDSLRARLVPLDLNSAIGASQEYGYVILDWVPNPADDDINYFDIAFANDTTHVFLLRNEGGIRERMFLDSLALDVNQKYIYYQVRAVDNSTNIGPWSPWIQVKRPHITPPTTPHLDTSAHSDEKGMHMEWIVGMDADMDYHLAYRRVGEKGNWEVIGRYDQDSLVTQGYRIIIDDNPSFDREQRYYYYIESHNSSPYTANSLAVSWLHSGPKVWQTDIKLIGDYFKQQDQTRLVWETGKLPIEGDYYYCIYRKGQGDDRFQFMVSVPKTDLSYTDQLLRKGEQAEYYVMIQWRDGRQSTPSNTITVTRPSVD